MLDANLKQNRSFVSLQTAFMTTVSGTWPWYKSLGSGLREGCLSHKICTHIYAHTLFFPASSYVILYPLSAVKCETVCKEKAPCKVSKSVPWPPINWSRERIKCLSQDKNLRSFWLSILYSNHTLSLVFQTSSGLEWLLERNRSLPQLLHSQSHSHKVVTSFRNKEMPIWVSRCQLYLWWAFTIAWALQKHSNHPISPKECLKFYS